MHLNQKETALLKDLKEQEQLCIDKYNRHSSEASDGQLKSLFSNLSKAEQQHLDTINQIMSGSVPNMSAGGNGQQKQLTFSQTYTMADTSPNKTKDCYLCTDLLSTEKHVSSTYDTSVFEFRDTGVRDTLNHIQKEEQEHGEQIYNYMAQNGMYN